jgi:3-phosphoshikimate 1-carboxyvinyltransferase
MGADVEEFEDGLSIKGGVPLKGAAIESYGDHRIAMAMAIAGLIAEGTTTIYGISSVNISYPWIFSTAPQADIMRQVIAIDGPFRFRENNGD